MDLSPAINKLKEYLNELEQVKDFESVQAKAEHIGNISRIDSAIKLLLTCEKYSIHSGSWFLELPPQSTVNHCFRVVCDCESENPKYWEEVSFDKHGSVLFEEGDIIIKR